MAKYIFEMDDEGNVIEDSVAPYGEPTPAPTGVASPEYSPENATAIFTDPGAAGSFIDAWRNQAGFQRGDEPVDDPLMEAGYRQEKFYTDPLLAYSRFMTPPAKVGPILWLGGSPVPLPEPTGQDTTSLMLSATDSFLRALAKAKRKKTTMESGQ